MGFGAAFWQELVADFPGNVEVARIVVRLGMAALLGGLLGFQRAQVGKAAGTRTHMLVTLGAAIAVLVPQLAGMPDAEVGRVIQGVLAGIGFIGGGVILKMSEQHQIVGITTASTIWLTATLGVAAGTGHLVLAVIGAVLAFLILTILGSLERWIITNGNGGTSKTKETPPREA